ncbi:MAG: replication protein [Chloroflexota bacterium]|nr:replication protein [Chloroflexota bacterium]
MKVKPFNKPESQFTQLHNSIFDVIMRECTPNEWQVLCAVIRKTRGWDKAGDKISYSQIMDLTGIASKSTVSRAVQGLIKKSMITADCVNGATTYYQLNTDYTIEQTSTETVPVEADEADQSKNCTGTSPKTVPPTGTDSVHTKDIKSLNKEINKKKQSSFLLKKLIHHFSIDQTPQSRKFADALRHCRPFLDDNGALILKLPDSDDVAYMTDRLLPYLRHQLIGITGKSIDVKFELLEGPKQ